MLTLVGTTLVAALLVPRGGDSARGTRQEVTRRKALQLAPAVLFLPSAAKADVYDERSGFGGTGGLRSDIGESIKGDGVEILLSDLSYKELPACPKKFFLPEKGGPWICLEVSATAFNQGKRTPTAAEVFGQIFDAEGFSSLATALDPTQKTPTAIINEPFPKGKSKPITFTVAVRGEAKRPFRFGGFKASYRNAAMERVFEAFDECEIDSSKCEDGEEQPENANALREGRGFSYNPQSGSARKK